MIDLRPHLKILSEIKLKLAGRNAKLINLTISGAHLYGFESPDSDIDYRGMFIANTREFLGLHKLRDIIEMKVDNNDMVLFELSKELDLCLKGNCNVLEHLNADQIFTSKEFVKLKQLINNAFGKDGLYNSYKGMATFNFKKFILGGKSTVKKYLYVFRGLMAGIYVLQTGQIQPNIEVLNKYFKIPEVKKLIEIKKAGKEDMIPPKDLDTGTLESKISELLDKIDDAYSKSKIAEKPSEEEIRKINEAIVNMRLDYLREMK